jgi:hypothetical protein
MFYVNLLTKESNEQMQIDKYDEYHFLY